MKVHKEIRSFILGCLFRATSQGRRNEFQSGGAKTLENITTMVGRKEKFLNSRCSVMTSSNDYLMLKKRK